MKIRDLGDALFITAKHLLIKFNIFGETVDGSPVITSFTRHVYIIERLKTKMLKKKRYLKYRNDDSRYWQKPIND